MVVAVAVCPFCMTMPDDGVRPGMGERKLKILDIAELLDIVASDQCR